MMMDDEGWEGDRTAPQFEAPEPPPELRLGEGAMVDHFRIVRPIGRGGMGELYVARDTELGRRVALKVIRDERVASERAVASFLEEARTTARFNHPHIVTIYAVGRASTGPLPEGTPYLALEYLEGQDLARRLAQRQPSLQETMRIGIAVARALEEAHHHGVLHLDLKPANVFVARDGRPRVLDFGLARVHAAPSDDEARRDDKDKRVWGTPNYMAPEQWRAEPLTAATDVWALGMMLFEMLVDELPFDQGSVKARAQSVTSDKPAPRVDAHCTVPLEIADLVARCLEKSPRRRPSAAELAEALQEMLQGPRRAVSLEQNPFRGLLPFTQRHAELFFGRDEETAAFVERMRVQPVLPVVGPSGAGKSSFVLAGVVPRLCEQDLWIVLHMRPGTRPFHALAARLVHSESRTITVGMAPVRSSTAQRDSPPPPQAADVVGLVERMRTAPRRLSLELRDLADCRGAKVLLVVDQLEELFTLVDDAEERTRFMEAVCTAADDPADPVRVVFTVRDDFLGRLVTGPEVRDALAQVTLIQPLGPSELEQVLERPAEALGYRFEPGLISEMVGEVSREASGLPLLQFAAHRLWEERDTERRLILHSAYRAMGGVAGALAQHADGVFDGFGEDELRIARELCLRLVTPERTRKVVPKKEAIEGLDARAAEAVLTSLIAARLVSARRAPLADAPVDGDVVRLELVHESLIDEWRALGRWLDESQEGLSFLAEAGQAAQLWHKRGRRPEEVWQGAALEDALRKLAQCRTEVPALVREFLREGEARRERHSRRRRSLLAGGMVASLLVAAIAVAIAFYVARKEREALAQKDRALAQRAEALLESAREALAQQHVLEARAKLRDALTVQDSPSGRALWWQLSAEPLSWSRELGTLTYDAAFSADGKILAVASHDKNVHVFDAVTGDTRMLRGHSDQVWSVASGGSTLVSGTWNGEIALWDAGRGELTRLIRAHDDAVNDLDVSRDGLVFASASSDGTAVVWRASDGKRKRALPHPTDVNAVALSPDGAVVATGTPDGRVRLFRGGDSREIGAHDDAVLALDMSPDGTLLASAGADNTVRLWRTGSGAPVKELRGHRSSVRALVFCSGELLASGANDGSVRLWSLPAGRTVAMLGGHTGGVRGLAASGDGHYLSSLARDFVVRMWDVRVGTERAPSSAHSAWVYAASFSPDGATIASASMDRTIGLWDVATGEQRYVLEGHTGGVHDVAFSPNGELLASAGLDQTARLWDLKSGAELRVLRGHRGTLRTLGFSPDGGTLATAGGDGTVRLWDVERGGELAVIRGHIGDVFEASFDPHGDRLATAGNDGKLQLWRAGTWTSDTVLEHGDPVRGASFSPDGGKLATGTDAGDVLLWDLGTRTSAKLARHGGRVYHLSFDPAGKRIGAPSSDGLAIIRSVAAPSTSAVVLRGHRSEVNTLRFSPDGTLALTSSDDGTLRLWDAQSGRPSWRAPALLARGDDSPLLLTHRGWLTPEVAGAARAELDDTAWRRAVEERARFVDAQDDGTLCVQTHDGAVELWERANDRRAAGVTQKGIRQLVATPRGCLVLSDEGAVWLHAEHGVTRLASDEPPTAVGLGAAGVYVAAGREILAYPLTGERSPRSAERRYRASIGVTALLETEDALLVGYRDGSVESLPLGAQAAGAVPHFELMPESPVVRLLAGPMATLVVGYANGLIGMWSQRDGRRLTHARLHGQVVHMLIAGHRLYAATDLGRHLVWDLSAFYRERCELLREIWERVPVVWEHGRAVRRSAPDDHPCAAAR